MLSVYQEKPSLYTAISLRLGEHFGRLRVDKPFTFGGIHQGEMILRRYPFSKAAEYNLDPDGCVEVQRHSGRRRGGYFAVW